MIVEGRRSKTFSDILEGEVFRCNNEALYMRTEDVDTERGIVNAVNIRNGGMYSFALNEAVQIVEGKFVLEG